MAKSLAKRNRVRQLWYGIPETWRVRLVSALNTFVSVFVAMFLYLLMESDNFVVTRAMLVAAASAGIRAMVKPTNEAIGTRVLPDPK